jgi:hypothetical protein
MTSLSNSPPPLSYPSSTNMTPQMDSQELEEAISHSLAGSVLSNGENTQADATCLSMATESSLKPSELPNNQRKNSPLLRLPPELRNYIYELAVVPVHGVAKISTWCLEPIPQVRTAVQPPIPGTCRQIRNEALPIFYNCSVLYLEPDSFVTAGHRDQYHQALHLMAEIGEKNRSNLAHIIVEVDTPICEEGKKFAVRVTRNIINKNFYPNSAPTISILDRKGVKSLPALAQGYFKNRMGFVFVDDDDDDDDDGDRGKEDIYLVYVKLK